MMMIISASEKGGYILFPREEEVWAVVLSVVTCALARTFDTH